MRSVWSPRPEPIRELHEGGWERAAVGKRAGERSAGEAAILKEGEEPTKLKSKSDELAAMTSKLEHHIGGLRELLKKGQAIMPN